MPTKEVNDALRELYSYDPDTGKISRLKRRSSHMPTQDAGAIGIDGYSRITFRRKCYFAHRLAWFLHHGDWPSGCIDHKDGNPLNNRMDNLRIVSIQTNSRNLGVPINNTSGVVGVVWVTKEKKWRAQIKADRKQKYLGMFDTIFDAAAARRSAEIKLGFSHMHGQRPSVYRALLASGKEG